MNGCLAGILCQASSLSGLTIEAPLFSGGARVSVFFAQQNISAPGSLPLRLRTCLSLLQSRELPSHPQRIPPYSVIVNWMARLHPIAIYSQPATAVSLNAPF